MKPNSDPPTKTLAMTRLLFQLLHSRKGKYQKYGHGLLPFCKKFLLLEIFLCKETLLALQWTFGSQKFSHEFTNFSTV